MAKKKREVPPEPVTVTRYIQLEGETKYVTNWHSLWWSLTALGWVICGLIHYQILKGQAVGWETQGAQYSQNCIPINVGKKETHCYTIQSGGINVQVSTWSRGDREGALVSTIFGPGALLFDFANDFAEHRTEKASW